VYQEVLDRIARKHAAAASHLPEPVVEPAAGASIGVVTVGSCDMAVREALGILATRGIAADYMRVRGFLFASGVRAFLDRHPTTIVVEMNRDAQLRTL